MVTVNLTQAKARLSELRDKEKAGQDVVITRRGKAEARMSATAGPRMPIPLQDLAEFRSTMPRLRRTVGELIRELRNAES